MENQSDFSQALEAADRLSLEEQETLVDILHRRTIDRRRKELAKDISAARQELARGDCKPATPKELMGEILS